MESEVQNTPSLPSTSDELTLQKMCELVALNCVFKVVKSGHR